MIEQRGGAGDGARRPRFRPTPWRKESGQWRRIDAELEEGHPARVIAECVESCLDLSGFLNEYGRRGSPTYCPKLVLKAVLFAMARGRADEMAGIWEVWGEFGIAKLGLDGLDHGFGRAVRGSPDPALDDRSVSSGMETYGRVSARSGDLRRARLRGRIGDRHQP